MSNVQIPKSITARRIVPQIDPSVQLSTCLEFCAQSQTQKVTTVTKMAPPRHPTPETVGTCEISRAKERTGTEILRVHCIFPFSQTIAAGRAGVPDAWPDIDANMLSFLLYLGTPVVPFCPFYLEPPY